MHQAQQATGRKEAVGLIHKAAKLKTKFDLGDIFRIRNQSLKRFTFRQKTPCLARRLDRFLISNLLQQRVSKCEILRSLLSDHSYINNNKY